MRKNVRENLIEIIPTIVDAHEIALNYAKSGEIDLVMSVFTECQDAMVKIGEIVEANEGENHKTIEFLQGYCDELYEVSLVIAENGESNFNKLFKRIEIKLNDVLRSIKNDIKVRSEIVFMPYKASMWDSLESVWKAADEDPDCDAYVIPIPYYDRKADTSFGEMHYEGEDFPDYVPITHYDAYNLETRHPDAIYIHNPYDDCNYLTSVDPRFYSKELRNYTDCLVYIPYFVLEEPNPNDPFVVESISGFATQPAVINAHKVIVQSEAMREVYIKALLEKYGDIPKYRKFFESKISGEGSPKFDKVCNTTKADIEIPDEWLQIIQKEDGSYKKVILYNTHWSALLQHNEKMLKKIESVLKTFYENRDNVALLWRPHPLTKTSIESMHPELWEGYKRIVDKYIDEGWGIYDDTPDLNRAIALSDAYYGDPSSLTQLYLKVHKAFLYQNVSVLGEDENVTPFAENVVVMGEKVYAPIYNFNGIMKFEISNDIQPILTLLPEYNVYSERLYNSALQYGKKLVFVPFNSSHIAVYNTEDNSIKMYKLQNSSINEKFCGGYVCKDYIVMIPYYSNYFVKFYPETGAIEYVLETARVVTNHRENTPYFDFYSFNNAKKIYMTIFEENKVIELDAETFDYNCIEISQSKSSFRGGCIIDDNMWLTGYDDATVYKLDLNSRDVTTLNIFDRRDNKNLNYHAIHINEYVIIFPVYSGEIKYINTRTCEVSYFDFLSVVCDASSQIFGSNFKQISGPFCFENSIYFWDSYNYGFYRITIINGEMKAEKLNYKKHSKKTIIEQNKLTIDDSSELEYNKQIVEKDFYGLREYLNSKI